MNIFGIGLPELTFVILIALIIMGPKDIVKTSRSIGRFLNKLVNSPNWRLLQRTTQEIRNLPTTLMREANLEDTLKDIPNPGKVIEDIGLDNINKEIGKIDKDFSDWTKPLVPAIHQDEKPEPPEEAIQANPDKQLPSSPE